MATRTPILSPSGPLESATNAEYAAQAGITEGTVERLKAGNLSWKSDADMRTLNRALGEFGQAITGDLRARRSRVWRGQAFSNMDRAASFGGLTGGN